jgi:hypothetical protein
MRPVIITCTLTSGVLPLLFDILLVIIPIYAFMSVHDTIQLKCSLIRQTHGVQENPICQSFIVFPYKFPFLP